MSIFCTLGQSEVFCGKLELGTNRQFVMEHYIHLGSVGRNVFQHKGKETNESALQKDKGGSKQRNRDEKRQVLKIFKSLARVHSWSLASIPAFGVSKTALYIIVINVPFGFFYR